MSGEWISPLILMVTIHTRHINSKCTHDSHFLSFIDIFTSTYSLSISNRLLCILYDVSINISNYRGPLVVNHSAQYIHTYIQLVSSKTVISFSAILKQFHNIIFRILCKDIDTIFSLLCSTFECGDFLPFQFHSDAQWASQLPKTGKVVNDHSIQIYEGESELQHVKREYVKKAKANLLLCESILNIGKGKRKVHREMERQELRLDWKKKFVSIVKQIAK